MTRNRWRPDDLTETARLLASILIDPPPAEHGGDTELRRRMWQAARIVHSVGIGIQPADIVHAVTETVGGFTDPFHHRDDVASEVAVRLSWLTDPHPDFAVCPRCGGEVQGSRIDLTVGTVRCPACARQVTAAIPLPAGASR